MKGDWNMKALYLIKPYPGVLSSYTFSDFQDGDGDDLGERRRLMRHARKRPGTTIVGKRSIYEESDYWSARQLFGEYLPKKQGGAK